MIFINQAPKGITIQIFLYYVLIIIMQYILDVPDLSLLGGVGVMGGVDGVGSGMVVVGSGVGVVEGGVTHSRPSASKRVISAAE